MRWPRVLSCSVIVLCIFCSPVVSEEASPDSPMTYAMRSKILPFSGLGNALRCFDLTTDKILSSDWLSHDIMAINVLPGKQVLLSVRNSLTSDYAVLRYDGITRTATDWIPFTDFEPGRLVFFNSKLYVFGGVPAPHPEDPASATRIQVYLNDPALKIPAAAINIREGVFAVPNGIIQDVASDPERNRLYVLVTGVQAGSHQAQSEEQGYILVLDAGADQLIARLELPYLQSLRGICLVKSLLYVAADFCRKPGNPWSPNSDIWVMDLDGKQVKAIPDARKARQLIWSPDDNRLFVSHEKQGKNPPFISILNLNYGSLEDRFPIPGLEAVEYVGNHRLFTATNKKLVVWNTRTLKVNREFKGRYLVLGKH